MKKYAKNIIFYKNKMDYETIFMLLVVVACLTPFTVISIDKQSRSDNPNFKSLASRKRLM